MRESYSKNEFRAHPVEVLSLSKSSNSLVDTWLDKPGVLESACPFCGRHTSIRYKAHAHDTKDPKNTKVAITQCTCCTAAWQWPVQRTSAESVVEFLGFYESKAKESYFDPDKRSSIAELQREYIANNFKLTGSLLDIGCGDGCFAKIMAAHGWQVTGLDPALPHSYETGTIRLLCGTFAELPADEKYDVITLWDVVEHVENPFDLIVEAGKRLAPDGVMIVETGNFQSGGRITESENWWNYQMDHRWYLAPPQLAQLMIGAGLTDIRLANRVLRPWWKGEMKMPAPSLFSHIKAIVKRPHRILQIVRRYRQLLCGHKAWGAWGGMEIMTMTGRCASTSGGLGHE